MTSTLLLLLFHVVYPVSRKPVIIFAVLVQNLKWKAKSRKAFKQQHCIRLWFRFIKTSCFRCMQVKIDVNLHFKFLNEGFTVTIMKKLNVHKLEPLEKNFWVTVDWGKKQTDARNKLFGLSLHTSSVLLDDVDWNFHSMVMLCG